MPFPDNDPLGNALPVELPDTPGNFTEAKPVETGASGKPVFDQPKAPSLLDRFVGNAKETLRDSTVGAASNALLADQANNPRAPIEPPPEDDPAARAAYRTRRQLIGGNYDPEILQDRAREELDRRINDQIAYKSMPSYSGFTEGAAALTGTLAGGLMAPENILFPEIKTAWFASKPLLGSMFRFGLGQSIVQPAADATKQALEVQAGLKKEFDASETMWQVPIGFAFGAGIKAFETVGGAAYRATVDIAKEKLRGVVTSPLNSELRPPIPPEAQVPPRPVPAPVGSVEPRPEPPVPEGMTRLYRADSPNVSSPNSPGSRVEFSRDVTQAMDTASWGAKPGERTILSYIDVPEETALALSNGHKVAIPGDVASSRQVLPEGKLELPSEKPTEKAAADNEAAAGPTPEQARAAALEEDLRTATEQKMDLQRQMQDAQSAGDKETIKSLRKEIKAADSKINDLTVQSEKLKSESNIQARDRSMPAGNSVVPTDVNKTPINSTAKAAHEIQVVDNLKTAMHDVADALDLTVRQGVKNKANLAEFDKETQIIRVRGSTARDFFDFAHELGHYVEKFVGKKMTDLIDRHVASMGAMNSNVTGRGLDYQGREGFAEFVAGYVTNRQGVISRAPVFVKEFEKTLANEAPQLLDALERAHRAYVAYDTAPTIAKDMVVTREDLKKQREENTVNLRSAMGDLVTKVVGGERKKNDILGRSVFGQWADKFYTNYVDRLHPFTIAQEKLKAAFYQKYGNLFPERADQDIAGLAQMWANGASGAGMQDALNGIADRNFVRSGPAILQTWQKVIANAVTGADQTDAIAARAAIDKFDKYLIARWHLAIEDQRASGMSNMSRPATEYTSAQARAVIEDVERMHPEWKSHAEEVYDYNRRLARKMYDNGLIGREKYEYYLHPANNEYVPLRRNMEKITEDSVGAFDKRNQSNLEDLGLDYARRGSDREILSPMESILLRTMTVNDQIAQNEVFHALRNMVKAVGGKEGALIAEEIPNTKIRQTDFAIEEAIYQGARKNGWTDHDARDLAQTVMSQMGPDTRATLLSSQRINAGGKPVIFGWDKGERIALQLTDGEFGTALQQAYDAMGPTGASRVHQSLGLLSDLFVTTASTLRAGATGTPTFMVKNAVRDAFMQFLLIPEVRIPGVASIDGARSLWKEDKFWELYQATSGIRGGVAANALSDASRVAAAIKKAGVPEDGVSVFGNIKEVLSKMEVTETAGRMGIFKSVYDANIALGRDERWAIYDAAQKARDFIDYGRYGSKMLPMSRIVPFLNANIQGIDKFLRTYGADMWGTKFTQAEREYQQQLRQQLMGRAAVLGTISYGISMLYADDPVYQSIPLQMRSQYWIFRLPMMSDNAATEVGGKMLKGNWIVVPKPFEPATIFNIAERVQQFIHTGDGTEIAAAAKSLQYTMMPPNPFDLPILKTLSGLESNYNSFFDTPIIPETYQKVAPHLQANQYTNQFYKVLASALNEVWASQDAHKTLRKLPYVGAALAAPWSPMEAQYLAQGLFGDVPRELGGTAAALKAIATGGMPKVDDVMGVRAFVRSTIASGQPMRETYNQIGQTEGRLTVAAASYERLMKDGDFAGAKDYFDKLDQSQRDFVRLKSAGGGVIADNVNPMVRMSNFSAALRDIRNGLALDAGLATLADPTKRIKLEPGTRDIAVQILTEMTTVEARNSLTVQGVTGYAGHEIISTKPYMDMLKAVSPALANEVSARMAYKKVLPIETVQQYWPRMQDAIRAGGEQAVLQSAVKSIGFEAVAAQGYYGGGTKAGRSAVDSSGAKIKRGKAPMPGLPAEGAAQ